MVLIFMGSRSLWAIIYAQLIRVIKFLNIVKIKEPQNSGSFIILQKIINRYFLPNSLLAYN